MTQTQSVSGLRLACSMLFFIWLALGLLGFVMVTSASVEHAAINFGSLWYFSLRHAAYLGVAAIILAIVRMTPIRHWYNYHRWLFAGGLLLLAAVLLPQIGVQINGSRRWISLPAMSLQPAELFKLLFIIYVAAFLARMRKHNVNDRTGLVRLFLVVALPVALVLLQPDFGSAVLLILTVFIMLFIAGVGIIRLFGVGGIAIGLGVWAIISEPYRAKRFIAFIDPWAVKYDSGYQLTQSLIALGRGDWSGLGLGRSIQKLFYLPEAHTDFLFAILGEELGFIGTFTVVGLFLLLVLCGMYLSWHALSMGHAFAGLLAIGAAWLLGVQAFINIGVNTGMLPTKGLTLPLMSYGGSSLVISSAMIGLLLRIGHELANRKPQHVA